MCVHTRTYFLKVGAELCTSAPTYVGTHMHLHLHVCMRIPWGTVLGLGTLKILNTRRVSARNMFLSHSPCSSYTLPVQPRYAIRAERSRECLRACIDAARGWTFNPPPTPTGR